MAKHVIIHMPSLTEDIVQWAVATDQGLLTTEVVSSTLAEAALQIEGRRVSVVLPGDDILLAEAVVPGGSMSRALQAVPYALEDQLADDVDSLHFALGTRGENDSYPVAVISRSTMDQVTELCAVANLRPTEIVPETLALPKFKGTDAGETSWTALVDKEQTVVRLNGYKGFSTDSAMAGIMLDGAHEELAEDMSASMVVFRTDPQATLAAPAGVDIETRACDSRLSLYASGLSASPHINLLQGDYSPKNQFDKAWKPWRWTAVLAAVLAIALFAGKVIEYQRISKQVAELDREIETHFKSALPKARMQRPKAQISAALKQLGAGSTDGFTNRLSQIAASLATQPQTLVKSISYRNGRFDLDVTTDAIPTLDQLASELNKRGGLSMKVQSTNRDNGGVRSRVRVE